MSDAYSFFLQQPSSSDGAYDSFVSPSKNDTNNAYSLFEPKDSWSQFTDKASELSDKFNFPKSVLLGQASLESARGTSPLAKSRNNYFGYMAYDSDPNQAKSYSSPDQSIMDYINLIESSPRYTQAYQQYLSDKDPVKLLQSIKNAGYATDPNYVTKVMGTSEFKENL